MTTPFQGLLVLTPDFVNRELTCCHSPTTAHRFGDGTVTQPQAYLERARRGHEAQIAAYPPTVPSCDRGQLHATNGLRSPETRT
jgi:hypothetical protein